MTDRMASSLPRRLNRTARKRPLISLTPLIDVVFILLVFFMLASSFLDWRAIDLAAPTKLTGGAGATDGALLIEIQPDGLRLAAEPVSLGALTEQLRERIAARPEQRVLIKAHRGVPLQRTVDILDRLKAAGVEDVSLLSGETS